ncbi:MAG: DMT family transporter, partial [Pseudomonadota bacterium]
MISTARLQFVGWWSGLSGSARGIAVMVISTIAFTAMHVAISAVSADLHPFQIAFFRNLFGLMIFIPVFWRSGLAVLHTDRLSLHVVRSILNVVAMLAFFSALAMSPIARVTALGFTAPLFMAVMSIVVLGERLVPVRAAALALGFAGTLIIIRPGFIPLDVGALLTVASAFVWAVCMLIIKRLSETDSSLTITAYMILWLSLFSFVPALFVWQWPEPTVWLWLSFIGLAGTVAQLLLTESLKQADATVVMPFDFLKLVWASLFGAAFFQQIPDVFTWVGDCFLARQHDEASGENDNRTDPG